MDLSSNHCLEVLYCVWKYNRFILGLIKSLENYCFFINQLSHFNSMRKPATLNSK